MNAASTIEISKSSLLSLKAEVIRKQQEVNHAKQQAKLQQPPTQLRQKNVQNEQSNKGVKDRQEKDELEDTNLLEKSRRILEAKTRLYNKLSKGPRHLTEEEMELNTRLLVQFDRKPRNDKPDSEDETRDSDDYDPPEHSDDEWVDYVDCLGRTRRCLRKDLEHLKEKDRDLRKSVDKRLEKTPPKWADEEKEDRPSETTKEQGDESEYTENSELLSNDMRRELLRKEWEKQEQELMDKKDIHYQDILFNEARSHGVSYYAFSKDGEERAKQQEELRKLREETKEQQKTSLEQKTLREKQLAERLKAARNRKRARMGLPPEEDNPEETPKPVEEKIDEKQQETTEKEAEEKRKDEARKKTIRPWDIGKKGLKQHYEYSQEEWVDKKRLERPTEFAPPNIYRSFHGEAPEKDLSETDKSLFFTTKRKKMHHMEDKPNDVRKESTIPEPKGSTIPMPNFNERISSINPYKAGYDDDELQISYSGTVDPTPIEDEPLDSEESNHSEETVPEQYHYRQGAQIPPPPTFDYYGSNQQRPPSTSFVSRESLEESVAAGLRYLREQAEKREKASNKHML